MAKGDMTSEIRRYFVTNLRRLMEERGFTPSETARKAGISDFKRFHRWASSGITRATHENAADLDKLQVLFGLPSYGQLFRRPEGEAHAPINEEIISLADRILLAGSIEWEYAYAYRLLVVLRHRGIDESRNLRDGIDGMFDDITETKPAQGYTPAKIGQTPDEILEPKTAVQIWAFLKINRRSLFERFTRPNADDEKPFLQFIQENLDRMASPKKVLSGLIKWAINNSK